MHTKEGGRNYASGTNHIYYQDCAGRAAVGSGCPWMVRTAGKEKLMGFEMQTSGSDMAVQDNARWERNCRMAKEIATVLVAVAGIIGIAVEYANEKRKE